MVENDFLIARSYVKILLKLIINKGGMQQHFNVFRSKLEIENLSQKTIKAYLNCLKNYSIFIKNNDKLSEKDIEDFLVYLYSKKYAPKTIKLHRDAILKYYRLIHGFIPVLNLKIKSSPVRLPVVLAKSDLERIFDVTKNKKHKLMLMLTYGSGLRVSEVINLKVKDLDFSNNMIFIRQAKGNKDRITILPKNLITLLKSFVWGKDVNDIVFESAVGGKLSQRTLQKIFHSSLVFSGIKKDATFHSLRHSFATHLLESGVNLNYIKELLGHSNIKTTMIYTKVTNTMIKSIKSPID